ncbi:expressed unknown protein [Seminavis robusta]|uniref:Uncharacterized protein n=1 Tax=Seminavis robusta TaxID=568900 RepID=A0A9N8DTX5_9STRA|nr:expressed unknown protein [Seminavis robusta]|eukprot:Sro354_g124800.1 n/a (175) ;mRNA; r:40489-41128
MHRIMVVSSYFRSMSEETKVLTRKRSVKAQLAGTSLLVQSGNLSAEHEEELGSLMRSFLMGLAFGNDAGKDENDNNNLRQARIMAMPNGFFLGAPPNVLGVSKDLKIGYAEGVYLREFLGKAKFGKILTAHGINSHSPMEEDWSCPDTPAAPGVAAKPCPNADDDVTPVMFASR